MVDGQPVSNICDILHHFKAFLKSLAQSHLPSAEESSASAAMEQLSFSNGEQLLDTEICVEEIENALKLLKLGKYGGLDGLSPEHIVYGG